MNVSRVIARPVRNPNKKAKWVRFVVWSEFRVECDDHHAFIECRRHQKNRHFHILVIRPESATTLCRFVSDRSFNVSQHKVAEGTEWPGVGLSPIGHVVGYIEWRRPKSSWSTEAHQATSSSAGQYRSSFHSHVRYVQVGYCR